MIDDFEEVMQLFDEPIFKELHPDIKLNSKPIEDLEIKKQQRTQSIVNLNSKVAGKSDKVIGEMDRRVKAGTLSEKLFCEMAIEVGQLRQVSYQTSLDKMRRTVSHIRTAIKGLE